MNKNKILNKLHEISGIVSAYRIVNDSCDDETALQLGENLLLKIEAKIEQSY